jgi:hypothetical protein
MVISPRHTRIGHKENLSTCRLSLNLASGDHTSKKGLPLHEKRSAPKTRRLPATTVEGLDFSSLRAYY